MKDGFGGQVNKQWELKYAYYSFGPLESQFISAGCITMIFIHIANLPSRKLIIFLPAVQRAHFSVGSIFKIYWTELDFCWPHRWNPCSCLKLLVINFLAQLLELFQTQWKYPSLEKEDTIHTICHRHPLLGYNEEMKILKYLILLA